MVLIGLDYSYEIIRPFWQLKQIDPAKGDSLTSKPYSKGSFVLAERFVNHQSLSGESTTISNSNGFRFEAALFTANPEFFGDVRGTVLAPGQMLVSVMPTGEQTQVLQCVFHLNTANDSIPNPSAIPVGCRPAIPVISAGLTAHIKVY